LNPKRFEAGETDKGDLFENLADVLRNKGEYQEALKYYTLAHEIEVDEFGEVSEKYIREKMAKIEGEITFLTLVS